MPLPSETSLKNNQLEPLQKAIQSEGLDGWFFCNFRHRDKLADEILDINPEATNTRFWFYAVPAHGDPIKIIHSVEPDALQTLPGSKIFYVSRENLKEALKSLAGRLWAVNSSEELASISYLDAGMAEVLKGAGLHLVSAAGLIQRLCGLMDREGVVSHERAAVQLYEIVKTAWDLVQKAYKEGIPLYEGDIRNLMIEEMKNRHLLVSDHRPIIAAGVNSGNPHYDFTGKGALIKKGDVIQFDLWTKEIHRGAIYADISWLGIFAEEIPEETRKRFDAVVSAREGAISFIERELATGKHPMGAAVDRIAREIISSRGYQEGLKHRTGHGIDIEIHGSGVNIDSVEFPDSRTLLDGSCFSLEPGIYFNDYGMRTEIDVYIWDGKPVVSGAPFERQYSILHC